MEGNGHTCVLDQCQVSEKFSKSKAQLITDIVDRDWMLFSCVVSDVNVKKQCHNFSFARSKVH